MSKVQYIRQEKIFNPTEQRFKIVVLGAGSLGSFITLNLAKLGFNDIHVYDYDIVEDYNLPNQFYRTQDIGKPKVEALLGIVRDFADVELSIYNQKVTEKTVLPMGLNVIYILTFDTLKERKMIYDMLRGMNNYLLDVRMGGEEFSIMTSKMNDENDLVEHDKAFQIVPTDIPCGEKSVIYSVLAISSEVCNIVKKLNNEQIYPKKLNRHMRRNMILADVK